MSFFFSESDRYLNDIDRLGASMNYLARKLGEEKAREIERHPEDFFNANKFRYYQAKAYHRAIPFSFIATLMGVFAIGGYENSHKILFRKWPLVGLAGLTVYFVSYKAFEYKAGFRNDDYDAHTYAKYLLIMRNIRVKA